MKMYMFFLLCLFSLFTSLYSQAPGTLKWEYQTDDEVTYSPSIGPDGTIYVLGSTKDVGCMLCAYYTLYAINPDGSEKWKAFVGKSLGSHSPTISSDGTIYVGLGKTFIAFNPDSTKKWHLQTYNSSFTAPAIGTGGNIYVGKYLSLNAINSDGITQWEYEINNDISFPPIISSDSTIYVGSGGKIYAINSNGTKEWEFETGNFVFMSPAIGTGGTIYVGSWDSLLIAINSNGTKKWEFKTGKGAPTSPAISVNDIIYIGIQGDSLLIAISPTGFKKWEFRTDNYISLSSPAIDSDGNIYIASNDNTLYAIYPDGTLKWKFQAGKIWGCESSPAIDSDGTIYIGSGDGKLYAIFGGSSGLANSPWPKFRHDNQNTGNVALPVTSIVQNKDVFPNEYVLYPIYPNPFNPVTHIKFLLPKSSNVQIDVYNILGKRVTRLLNEKKIADEYTIFWNATNLSSGFYFIQLKTGDKIITQKCLLIK